MIIAVGLVATILGFFVIALLQRSAPHEPVDAAVEAERAHVNEEALDRLVAMEAEEFARMIRRLLTTYGLEVRKMEQRSEGDAEIIAHWPQELIGGNYVIHFARPVDRAPIESKTMREFKEAAYEERALKGIFITTSQFSQEAQFVGGHYGVEMVDGARLLDMLRERQPSLFAQLEQQV